MKSCQSTTELVVDANIIFATFIKSGKTAEILFESSYEFYVPSFFFVEFRKYKEVLLEKTNLSEKDFEEVLDSLS